MVNIKNFVIIGALGFGLGWAIGGFCSVMRINPSPPISPLILGLSGGAFLGFVTKDWKRILILSLLSGIGFLLAYFISQVLSKPTPSPTQATSPTEIDETENWSELYMKHSLVVGDTLTLSSFIDSRSNKKFIISKTVQEKSYPDLTSEEIYLSDQKNDLVSAKKILENDSESGLVNKPFLSNNRGRKFFILEVTGSGDYHSIYLFDEDGNEIKLDFFSQIKDNELDGTVLFEKWLDDTTIFEVTLGSFGPNSHRLTLDATTGKQIGSERLIPNRY